LLVEFDPEGQWFAVSRTMTALRIKNGLRVHYGAAARSRKDVIASLTKLGVDVDAAEDVGLLRIDDYYTSTLSLDKDNPGFVAVNDRYVRAGSPKIADWSIQQLRRIKGQADLLSKWGSDQSGVVGIGDSFSPLLRFNDEKIFLEWMETRNLQLNRNLGKIIINGMSRGVHSEPFYRSLEGMYDGVVEIRTLERDDDITNMLRIRSLKGQTHNSSWHEISVDHKGEASLVT
jgi:KaiC/GvpD/RAD55 family RecA-like ATPase